MIHLWLSLADLDRLTSLVVKLAKFSTPKPEFVLVDEGLVPNCDGMMRVARTGTLQNLQPDKMGWDHPVYNIVNIVNIVNSYYG